MKVAEETASLSKAERLKVGAIIVKDNRIISCGYNGLPPGSNDLNMEYEVKISHDNYNRLPDTDKKRYIRCDDVFYYGLKTNDDVIHAEQNSISRLASSAESGIGATMFITHSPCHNCSKIIYSSGIKEIYFKHYYRSDDGLTFLSKYGIIVNKYES